MLIEGPILEENLYREPCSNGHGSDSIQGGSLFRALRELLKRGVPECGGGDYYKVSQAIQKKSHPPLS